VKAATLSMFIHVAAVPKNPDPAVTATVSCTVPGRTAQQDQAILSSYPTRSSEGLASPPADGRFSEDVSAPGRRVT
jgi:hypothetical protein